MEIKNGCCIACSSGGKFEKAVVPGPLQRTTVAYPKSRVLPKSGLPFKTPQDTWYGMLSLRGRISTQQLDCYEAGAFQTRRFSFRRFAFVLCFSRKHQTKKRSPQASAVGNVVWCTCAKIRQVEAVLSLPWDPMTVTMSGGPDFLGKFQRRTRLSHK